MVRGPLCRPNSPLGALFEQDVLFEKETLSCTPRSSLPDLLDSIRRPTLEEKHLLWASFACRKSEAESTPNSIQSEDDCDRLPNLDEECESECIMARRTGQDLQIDIDSSPSKSAPATDALRSCFVLSEVYHFPSPPTAPRSKALSPKDIKEMKKTAVKIGSQQSVTSERESPANQPPTPPTAPRMSQVPRYRKRFAMPLETSTTCGSDAEACEQRTSEGAGSFVGDFRQCPPKFWSELHAKFCPSTASHTEAVVSRRTPPALTARQITSENDAELSETWKRFEQRKQERREARSRSKQRVHPVNLMAGFLRLSSPELRICGLMASKLAQPAELFSHRSQSIIESSISDAQVECTAFREWVVC